MFYFVIFGKIYDYKAKMGHKETKIKRHLCK